MSKTLLLDSCFKGPPGHLAVVFKWIDQSLTMLVKMMTENYRQVFLNYLLFIMKHWYLHSNWNLCSVFLL